MEVAAVVGVKVVIGYSTIALYGIHNPVIPSLQNGVLVAKLPSLRRRESLFARAAPHAKPASVLRREF
jgi:hypothetical protein